jgi:hypothetical protein
MAKQKEARVCEEQKKESTVICLWDVCQKKANIEKVVEHSIFGKE